jgi:mannosyltransferase OCH1-like enzyme
MSIPLNIFQIIEDADIKNNNTDFYYYTFEIKEAKSFIKSMRPNLIQYINSKSDEYFKYLWVLCKLYRYGGIYIDNNYKCADSFNLIKLTDAEYFVKQSDIKIDGSTILVVNPNNDIINKAIETYNESKIIRGKVLDYSLLKMDDNKNVLLNENIILNYIKLSPINNISNVIVKSSNSLSQIPLNLFQTWHTKDLPPEMKKSVELLKSQNPEFDHQLFDDADCREFIAANFDYCVVDAFDRLVPGAYKADLWRYCVLYIRGGVYLDIKYHCVNRFKLIELTDKEYFVRDRPGHIVEKKNGIGIYNAFMVCYPKNQRLLKCIYQIVKNVKNNYYGRSCLYPTGPGLLRGYFSDSETDNLSLDFDFLGVDTILYNKTRKILQSYGSYRSDQKVVQSNMHYNQIWLRKEIYKSSGDTRLIPLNIFQTWFTKDLPTSMRDSVDLLKSQNPEFTHWLFDDSDCRDFIVKHFDSSVVDAFDKLVPGAFKADLWRYCVLYIHGGIYLDIKYHCVDGFKLVELTDKEYYVRDLPSSGFGLYNAVLVSLPGNKKMRDCIYQIVENVRSNYYGESYLHVTGPCLMKQFFSDSEISSLDLELKVTFQRDWDSNYDHTIHSIVNKGNVILTQYTNYRVDQKKEHKLDHYSVLWKNRMIYK